MNINDETIVKDDTENKINTEYGGDIINGAPATSANIKSETDFIDQNGDQTAANNPPVNTANNSFPKSEETKKKKTSKLKTKGPYRTTSAFFVCGLIAHVPIVGLIALLYLRAKAKDQELRSYTTSLLYLRPIGFCINFFIFTFIVVILIRTMYVLGMIS